MDQQAFKPELEKLIGDFLTGQGLELIELICRFEGRDLFLRVLTDHPQGGITIGECAELNRQIGLLLDEKDIVRQRYILEVSSPGIDRPLKTKSDFSRSLGGRVHLFLNTVVSAKTEIEGIIKKIEGDSVYIEVSGALIEVPLKTVNKGKPIF